MYILESLVGGLEHFIFFHILGMSSSQLTNIFFRGVGQPRTRYLLMMFFIWGFSKIGVPLYRWMVEQKKNHDVRHMIWWFNNTFTSNEHFSSRETELALRLCGGTWCAVPWELAEYGPPGCHLHRAPCGSRTQPTSNVTAAMCHSCTAIPTA